MTACPICRTDAWTVAYEGPIRNGRWPETVPGVVRQCSGCGVARLDDALTGEQFANGEYWASVGEGEHAEGWSGKAEMLRSEIASMWEPVISEAVVLDVGAGRGALLKHIGGRAKWLLAVEPDERVAADLSPLEVFRSCADAGYFRGAVDFAFLLNTLEHTDDPAALLGEVRDLLAPGGMILLSTSNQQDVLLTISAAYPAFFYRRAQRWYFDMPSLATCAAAAGLEATDAKFVQRYGVRNAAAWQIDGKPTGEGEPHSGDEAYRRGLERKGISDRFYVLLRRKGEDRWPGLGK